jgi:hypothetical protein
MVNAVVLVATGVNADGHREVLGIKVATSETKEAWNAFFADLVARGLTSGPRLRRGVFVLWSGGRPARFRGWSPVGDRCGEVRPSPSAS